MKHIFILLISLFCLTAQAQTDTIIYKVEVINADSIILTSTVYENSIDYKIIETLDSTRCANRIILVDSLRIQDSLLWKGFEAAKIQMQTLENKHKKDYDSRTILKNILQTNQP